ncbi:MAG: hypothetical protein J5J00_11695 [Deltaproteobacteria bacterium]|nr:hypothetical protein [Deltaproteobacteria bacterium]
MKTSIKLSLLAICTISVLGAASSADAKPNRCKGLAGVTPALFAIQDFIKESKDLSEYEFKKQIEELNDSVNELFDTNYGCDPYSDNFLDQMVGAIAKVRTSRSSVTE